MAQASHQPAISSAKRGRRIVLTTFGSLGDFHPFVAIALGLKARGHEAVLATGECYRRKVEALGLGFRAVRPDSAVVSDPVAMRRFMDSRWGTVRVLRDYIVPSISESYKDTLAVVEGGADLLVSHPIAFATRLVAEKTGTPWVSTVISPLGLFSAFDPPAMPGFPDFSNRLRWLGPQFWGPLGWYLKRATRVWARPIDRLRSEIGLAATADNPLVDGHSPVLVLALFSKLLADKQIDWPSQIVHTGFPLYDGASEARFPPELARFLANGPPPIVFSLSASAAMVAGSFFDQSVAAAKKLGRRAVLIAGKDQPYHPVSLPDGMAVFDYAPFSELFPRACAIVHAGGIGTCGLAMRSGRPMMVVPHAHDQPENARRLVRLGIARTISRRRYRSDRVVTELEQLLGDPSYSQLASEVGEQIRREDGVQAACDALEALLK
jgi:rhamnosyltransferase subunit B